MNFRVLLLIFLVFLFFIGTVIFSFRTFETNSLNQAYQDGSVELIQNTQAGTVPHIVTIKNNGKQPLTVRTGQILTSNNSQDLVVAEDKRIDKNSSANVKAYCFEPKQKAAPGSKLAPSNQASQQITAIINNSNLSNIQNTTQTQLQIWILVSGNEVNINSGETSAFIEKQDLSNANILQELSDAKDNLITSLNISTNDLKTINQTSFQNNSGDIFNWINSLINEFITWIKTSFGIQI